MTDHHEHARHEFIRQQSDPLMVAARRHGKPFKCGPSTCRREVLVGKLDERKIVVRKAS